MQVAAPKNGSTNSAYRTGIKSSCRGSQITASALNGKRSATAKLVTADTANRAAPAAKATPRWRRSLQPTTARKLPLAP
jgi:hypothetical protein